MIRVYGLNSDIGSAHFLAHFRNIPKARHVASSSDDGSSSTSDDEEKDLWLMHEPCTYNIKDFSIIYDVDSALLSTKRLSLKPNTILQLYSFMEIASALSKNNHCYWKVNGLDQPLFRIPNVLIAACGQVICS